MKNSLKKNLIIYELNEVPKKIIDYYVNLKPNSNLAKLIGFGFYKETITDDIGELHPWSSWPTVHRGVDSSIHKINFINQNLDYAKNYPPIWEVLLNNQISIGIFGSLQSYPPLKSNQVKFYIPDTFAPKPDTYPKRFTKFQKLNLALTMRNKAIYRPLRLNDFWDFLMMCIVCRISIAVICELALQIIKECFSKKYKKRRSLMQPVLSFDIYKRLVVKNKPSFSTFFTNHVAGIMHRYWKDTFPDELDLNNYSSKDRLFNKKSLIKAMDLVDKQIGFLHEFQKQRKGELWIISALGQEAVNNTFKKDLILENQSKLKRIFDLDDSIYEFMPAMHPDLNIKCKDSDSLVKLRQKFSEIKDEELNNLFIERYDPVNNSINFVTESTQKLVETKYIYVNNKKYRIKELGLNLINRDIGTGYHTNKGIFISSHKLNDCNSRFINTKFFYNYLKDYFFY